MLPRVLSLPQVGHVIAHTPVEIEVFGFGSLCVMAHHIAFELNRHAVRERRHAQSDAGQTAPLAPAIAADIVLPDAERAMLQPVQGARAAPRR